MADVHTAQERARTLADPTSFATVSDSAARKMLRSYLSNGWLPVIPRDGLKRRVLLDCDRGEYWRCGGPVDASR